MALETSTNPILCRRPEDAQREINHRTTLRRTSSRRVMVNALQSRNAIKDVTTLPELEETLHIVARGNFPLWSLVPAVLKLADPATIESLHMATLGFSTTNVTDLLSLLDAGKIARVSVIASVYFERQNPAEYRQMKDGLLSRGHRIAAIRSHAKIITFALSDGRRFAVESSANLRSCRNIEQITITHSAALTDFHASWIDQAISTAAANDKRSARAARH